MPAPWSTKRWINLPQCTLPGQSPPTSLSCLGQMLFIRCLTKSGSQEGLLHMGHFFLKQFFSGYLHPSLLFSRGPSRLDWVSPNPSSRTHSEVDLHRRYLVMGRNIRRVPKNIWGPILLQCIPENAHWITSSSYS